MEQERKRKLRLLAENKLEASINLLQNVPANTLQEVKRLAHELSVYSIEIEMQNDELIDTQVKLESAQKELADLFEYAPVGYIVINEEAKILKANNTICKMLNIEKEKFTINSSKGWLGITDKYWLTALVPEKGKEFKSEFSFSRNKYRANYIIKDVAILNPGSEITNKINTFVAAKEVSVIDSYAEKLNIEKFDLAIDWGWFYFFTKPLFFIIDYFFKLTGNFGFAIVIITALIRLMFFPLANYSFKSMAKMKLLQPEMVRLKGLHKEDKVKLQQEMMALYKREKVNPVSGCLPVLIQIPFFFAIYKMLYVTLEMRHQPFFGWIKDLSDRDPTSVFNLFGLIPWDPPSFLLIGAWPILMGISMFIQQKLNPTPPDPIQAKIFMFFPIFLTIILAPFPSGLVVYWTVNNVLTIAQQWVIMRGTKVKTV